MHTCMHIYIHTDIHTQKEYTHTHLSYLCANKHIHTQMHACVHTYINTHTSGGNKNGYAEPTSSRTIGTRPKPGKSGLISPGKILQRSDTAGAYSHTRSMPPLYSPHVVCMCQSGFCLSAGAKRLHKALLPVWRGS